MAARKRKKKVTPVEVGETCDCGEKHGSASPEQLQDGAIAVAQSAKLSCAINHWANDDFVIMIAVANHMVLHVMREEHGCISPEVQSRIDSAIAFAMQRYEQNTEAEQHKVNATGSSGVVN